MKPSSALRGSALSVPEPSAVRSYPSSACSGVTAPTGTSTCCAVPSALGAGADGYEAARSASGPPAPAAPLHPTAAPVRYLLGTEVPGNWIPFLPVHVPGSSRSVQLQRGRMPGAARQPRGRVLSVPAPYYVNEEEVPRSGKIVTRNFQRARWLDGSTFLWIG